ncbi:uncharacterized protein LOC144578794 [Callithrix jacchus]
MRRGPAIVAFTWPALGSCPPQAWGLPRALRSRRTRCTTRNGNHVKAVKAAEPAVLRRSREEAEGSRVWPSHAEWVGGSGWWGERRNDVTGVARDGRECGRHGASARLQLVGPHLSASTQTPAGRQHCRRETREQHRQRPRGRRERGPLLSRRARLARGATPPAGSQIHLSGSVCTIPVTPSTSPPGDKGRDQDSSRKECCLYGSSQKREPPRPGM